MTSADARLLLSVSTRITKPAHTLAYVSIRQHTSVCCCPSARASQSLCRHAHTLAFVSKCQHTSAYGGEVVVGEDAHHDACFAQRHHTSPYVSIRQHTCAYVSIPAPPCAYASKMLSLKSATSLDFFRIPSMLDCQRVKESKSQRVSSVSITACLYVGFISFLNITLFPELKYETPRNASLRSGSRVYTRLYNASNRFREHARISYLRNAQCFGLLDELGKLAIGYGVVASCLDCHRDHLAVACIRLSLCCVYIHV